MGKQYKIHYEKTLTEDEILEYLKKAACCYNSYVDTDLMFIYSKDKKTDYRYYEIFFGMENFLHLAGCIGNGIDAKEFFLKCLGGTIKYNEFKPKKDINTTSAKISILYTMLDFRNSKLYKIGIKNLITEKNKFELATGNSTGILGYDDRKSNEKALPIPITAMKRPISDYVSSMNTIMFILQKDPKEKIYSEIVYTIKKDLLKEIELPIDIKEKIATELIL